MIDKDTAIGIAADHLAVIHPLSVDIMGFDFATYGHAKPSLFTPGPSNHSGWHVYFNYLNAIEGHCIICVEGETGEVYFMYAT